MSHCSRSLNSLAALVLACWGAHAHADEIASRAYLLGDWGGQRTRLEQEGITFNFGYGSQLAHNFSGGSERLTRYADQWTFGVSADLSRLWGWSGATFQGTVTDRNGRNLGADANIGNNMLLQEIYGRGQTWHLTQFWLEQRLFADRLQLKAGRLTVGEDFASFSCDFQNLTFCGSQPGNLVSNYWVNWPTSQWAARLKYTPSDRTYVQLGVYQVNPTYIDDDYARHSGWKLDNPSGTTGALIPLEWGWSASFNGLPGSYKVGGWYNTSDGTDLYQDVHGNPRGVTGAPGMQHNGQYGVYLSFQQQVTGIAGGRGATVFLNVSKADRATAVLDGQLAAGAMYQGPFERPRDAIGMAVGATHNNARHADFVRENNARTGQTAVAGSGNEYVVELFYNWSPLPSVFLRPNLQYVRRPGGTGLNADALVIGLKSGIVF